MHAEAKADQNLARFGVSESAVHGRFPPDAVQDECSFWSLGESAVHDPLLPFRILAILPLIHLTADIGRECGDGSR